MEMKVSEFTCRLEDVTESFQQLQRTENQSNRETEWQEAQKWLILVSLQENIIYQGLQLGLNSLQFIVKKYNEQFSLKPPHDGIMLLKVFSLGSLDSWYLSTNYCRLKNSVSFRDLQDLQPDPMIMFDLWLTYTD